MCADFQLVMLTVFFEREQGMSMMEKFAVIVSYDIAVE